MTGGEKRKDGAGVGREAWRGGIGGILMTKRGRIEDIVLRIKLIAKRRTGRERGIRIEGNGREATIEDDMSISDRVDDRNRVTLQTRMEGGGHEIDILITDDDDDQL